MAGDTKHIVQSLVANAAIATAKGVAAAFPFPQEHPEIESTISLITVQQGPGEVMVATKIHLARGLKTAQIAKAINEFEAELRARCPEVRWSFVEPDIPSDS